MGSKSALGLFYGISAGALWGLALLAPLLISPFTSFQLACMRFLSYGLIAGLLSLPRWKKLFTHIGRQEWVGLILLSLTGNIIYYALLGTAIQLAGVTMPTLIDSLLPVSVMIIGSREPGAVPLRNLATTILLSIAGLLCVAFHAYHLTNHSENKNALHILIGLLCACGALISWSYYTVSNTRWLHRLKTTSEHEWSLLTGLVTGLLSITLLPFAFIGHSSFLFSQWGWFLGTALMTAFFSSILGNLCWNKMSRLLPMTMGGQLILFETFFGLLYGFLYEHRLPVFPEIMAIIFIALSVLSSVQVHRRHETLQKANS